MLFFLGMGSERFSVRNGMVPAKLAQVGDLDLVTRTRLLNAVISLVGMSAAGFYKTFGPACIADAWDSVMHRSAAERDRLIFHGQLIELETFFRDREWYRIYEFVEVVTGYAGEEAIRTFSRVLDEENCGYRFVRGKLVAFTNREELQEVELAASGSSASADHIDRSLDRFGDRKAPDFRNAIKEAMSAVEAESRLLAGDDSAVLSRALANCKGLHPALRNGVTTLYGYASDSGGIRHAAGEGDREPTREEARLMIIVCSAVVNFLRAHRTSQTASQQL